MGNDNALGHVPTPEHKKNMSKSKMGHITSENTKQKISRTMKQSDNAGRRKQKTFKSKKGIRQIYKKGK